MARVFITGSAGGLGRLAAESVLDGGHDVIVHARNDHRLDAARTWSLAGRQRSSVTSRISSRRATSPRR